MRQVVECRAQHPEAESHGFVSLRRQQRRGAALVVEDPRAERSVAGVRLDRRDLTQPRLVPPEEGSADPAAAEVRAHPAAGGVDGDVALDLARRDAVGDGPVVDLGQHDVTPRIVVRTVLVLDAQRRCVHHPLDPVRGVLADVG